MTEPKILPILDHLFKEIGVKVVQVNSKTKSMDNKTLLKQHKAHLENLRKFFCKYWDPDDEGDYGTDGSRWEGYLLRYNDVFITIEDIALILEKDIPCHIYDEWQRKYGIFSPNENQISFGEYIQDNF